MVAEKTAPDWELAERLYRAGQISLRMIAPQCGVTEGAIRKKAKKEGWARDLTEKVQQAVRTELVRAEGTHRPACEPDPRTEREIVTQAAENAVAVVRGHRRDLSAGQAICATLFDQLKDAAENRAELEEQAHDEAGEGPSAGKRRAAFLKALSLPTHAGVIRDLSAAMKNFQTLERAAWNLDEKKEDVPEYEAELKRLAEEG